MSNLFFEEYFGYFIYNHHPSFRASTRVYEEQEYIVKEILAGNISCSDTESYVFNSKFLIRSIATTFKSTRYFVNLKLGFEIRLLLILVFIIGVPVS